MIEVPLEEAEKNLARLLREVRSGEEFVITVDDEPQAKLSALPPRKRFRCGFAKGTVLHIADDFDAPLEDFAEYM